MILFGKKEQYIKPEFIDKRDIAIISPSSPEPEFIPQKLQRGLLNLQKMGFKVKESHCIYNEYPEREEGYKERARIINSIVTDKSVGGLICKTGGSGSINILKFLEDFMIQINPKMLCGYSDNTSLLMYLNDKLKLVVFHGPTLVPGLSDLGDLSEKYFIKVFSENKYPLEIKLNSFVSWKNGKVTGKVIGGNLTVLIDYLNMFPETDFKNKILFLEEVGETPETINQFFQKLKVKGVFKDIKGILIGQFKKIAEKELHQLKQYLLSNLDKQIPVLYGFMSGHGKEKIPLPFGIDVTIDATALKVIYEECPFKV